MGSMKFLTIVKRHAWLLGLIAAYAGVIIWVRPFGNFPLNDSWAYAWSVRTLLDTGVLRISDWAAPSLIGQVLWGALFARVLGFSFWALRLSTLIASVAGVYCFFRLTDDLLHDRRIAGIAACALLVNPLYFNLSFTFMTDVPFLALILIACCCYARFARSGRERLLWAGALACALSVLVRQTGIAACAGMLIYLLARRQLTLRTAAATAILPLAALACYLGWFHFVHGPTWAQQVYVAGSLTRRVTHPFLFLRDAAGTTASTCFYAGLCAMPLALGALLRPRRMRFLKKTIRLTVPAAAGAGAIGLILTGVLFTRGPLPHFENILHAHGLGVLTAFDASAKYAGIFGWPVLWYLLTAAGAIAILFLIAFALTRGSLPPGSGSVLLPLGCVFLATLAGGKYFDRYTIVCYPGILLIAAAALSSSGRPRLPVFLLLTVIAGLSLAGTYDYFRWNEAKYALAERAPSHDIPRAAVAAGFDWNGWLSYEPAMAALKKGKTLRAITEWEWQGMTDYQALVSFEERPGRLRRRLLDRQAYQPLPGAAARYLYLWEL